METPYLIEKDGHKHYAIKYNCEYCNKEYLARLSDFKKQKHHFCSSKCSQLYKVAAIKSEIENGINVSQRKLRAYLLKLHNKCMNPNCCWDWTKNNNVSLEVHHIDGNSNNNVLSNVILLCPNCHSLTDTYKAKNTGNGRAFRRQRYKEGKSY